MQTVTGCYENTVTQPLRERNRSGGASRDKLAVQYAVLELGKQVGLTYELRGKEIVLKKLIVEGEGWRGFRLGAKRGRRHLRSKELRRTPP